MSAEVVAPQKLDKRTKLLQQVAKDWARCEIDPIFFIEQFCRLKDQKSGKSIPFKLWDCQQEQIWLWIDHRRSITLKTRQIGISWLSAAYILHQCLFRPYYEAMAVSRKESDAIKYLDKARFMYQHLPSLFKEMIPIKRENRLIMEWESESSFMAESSNPEAGRSETLNAIIIDEASFVPDSFSIWTAAEPTLEKADGQAIFISTGNGYDKFFQPIYDAAKTGENGFAWNFINWMGDPNRDQAWYDIMARNAKANGRLREFRAEYPRNDLEAFIVSGETFYDPELIEKLLGSEEEPYEQGMINPVGSVNLTPHSQGHLKVWKYPQPGKMYCMGVDVAEGLATGDNSVAVVYDRHSRQQVAEFSAKVDTDEFAKLIHQLGKWYGMALICLEMNTVGESVLNYLTKQQHYPRLFRQMRYDETSKKKVKKIGWRTTTNSKRIMLDALGAYLRENEMHPKSFSFFEELKTFVMIRTEYGNYKYEASGNKHDDLVVGHGLCAVVFQEAPPPPPVIRKINPEGKSRFGGIGKKNPMKFKASKMRKLFPS